MENLEISQWDSSKLKISEVESHFPRNPLLSFPSRERSRSLSLCDLTSGLVFTALCASHNALVHYLFVLLLKTLAVCVDTEGALSARRLETAAFVRDGARLVRAHLLAKGLISSVSLRSGCPRAPSLHRSFVFRRKTLNSIAASTSTDRSAQTTWLRFWHPQPRLRQSSRAGQSNSTWSTSSTRFPHRRQDAD